MGFLKIKQHNLHFKKIMGNLNSGALALESIPILDILSFIELDNCKELVGTPSLYSFPYTILTVCIIVA